MVERLKISDFNGNYNLFVDKCYAHYYEIWVSNPTFNNKPIVRDANLENGKEKTFWGIVEGHNDNKIFDSMQRYETVTFLKEIILNLEATENNQKSDILWFVFDRKINVFSKKMNYLIVLREKKTINYFVTSYPISESKKHKLIKKWKEYWGNNTKRTRTAEDYLTSTTRQFFLPNGK